jgi:hypothetical protein
MPFTKWKKKAAGSEGIPIEFFQVCWVLSRVI